MPTVSHQISGASSAGGYSELSYESADYEEEDDRFDGAAPEPIVATRQTSDVVLETADLVREQEGAIVSMSELFGCPRTVASVLLRKYNWNTEKLIDKFMDDPDAVLTEAGLDAEIKPMRQGSSTLVPCGICFEDVSLQTSSACAQSHRFCNDCWNGYLVSQIGDGGALTIKCMQPKCPALVEPALVQALVDAPTFARFARFAQRQFVDDNPYIKWCPADGCTKAIKVGSLGKAVVSCSCGFLFCWRCSRESHFPMSCEQLDQWEEKNRSDSETAKWIKANTKKCPKCFWPIEKNGGCNHMTCRRKECNHEFCWLCLKDWRNHTSCSAYQEDPNAASAKAELERYLHYYERYAAHAHSQELEAKLRGQAEEKVQQLANSDEGGGAPGTSSDPPTVLELQYISDAAEALIECRRVLKNTYPVAYFMEAGPEKNLLEFLQANLETVTEELSRMLEAEGVPERVVVVSKAVDARQRLKHLSEGVEDGFANQAAAPRAPPATPMPARQTSAAARAEASALQSLADMGFVDEAAARQALAATGGLDVASASAILLAQRQG